MKELEIRTTMISVNSIDRSIGDETATDVKIVDEGAGEFVEVIQYYTDRMPDVPTINAERRSCENDRRV